MRIDADSAFLSYGARIALAGACLSCKTGEIVGLLGRNGSGKTSLLRMIFGDLRDGRCAVRLDDVSKDRLFLTPGAVAFLPQESFLPARFRVDSCIGSFLADPTARDMVRNDHFVRPLLRERVSDLSGGELRRIELLLVLSLDRAFFYLDEPFSELDPIHTERIESLLRERVRTAGIVVTDHDYRSILTVSDRLFLLRDGRTIHVRDREHLEELGYLPAK